MDRTDAPVRETERIREEDTYRRTVAAPVKQLNALDWVALWLTIIGGVNWGLIGLFDFNLVSAIFGVMTAATRVIYTIVGLASIYTIYLSMRVVKRIGAGSAM